MDDGQVALPPAAAAIYVKAFDSALSRIGGTRVGTDGKKKSTAKLLGSASALAAAPLDWFDPLEGSCDLLPSAPGGLVLGVGITAADTNAATC